MSARDSSQPLKYAATLLAAVAIALLGVSTNASRSKGSATASREPLTARANDPGGYLPWSSAPSPLPMISAYVGIGGAWGAGNTYNTATNAFMPTQAPGSGMLDTDQCYFVCFGTPAKASHHYIVYGNDISSTFFTHLGAADDCGHGQFSSCPGGINNQVLGVSVDSEPDPYFAAVDGRGNVGVLAGLYAASAVVAGASSTAPTPSAGSLVSHTGASEGDVLLGSTGSGNDVKCDFGETQLSTLTCNEPLVIVGSGATSAGINGSGVVWATGGVQPNGSSGGYAPEAFPLGVATAHPQMLSGSCTVTGSAMCTFPNHFAFLDSTYTCTVTAQGTTALATGYANDSATQITIYTGSPVATENVSYICIR
jgi:hypothetical protein